MNPPRPAVAARQTPVQWLEDLYDAALADHDVDPIGSPRDRAQAAHLARAARADTTGRTYNTEETP